MVSDDVNLHPYTAEAKAAAEASGAPGPKASETAKLKHITPTIVEPATKGGGFCCF